MEEDQSYNWIGFNKQPKITLNEIEKYTLIIALLDYKFYISIKDNEGKILT